MSSTDPSGVAGSSRIETITDPAVADDHPHHHSHSGAAAPIVHENAPFAYSLISWGSVLAGAAIAVVIGVAFNILGLAFGLSIVQPGDPDTAKAFTAGAGLWLALSTVLGMLVGGYVAARSAHNPDHHEGVLQGATVWAVGFLLALFLTGSTVGGVVSSGLQAAGGASQAAARSGALEGAAARARDAADAAKLDTAAERDRAETAADTGGAAAWWAFITMLASGIAAVIGGTLGAKHDEHAHRPRRTSGSNVF